MKSEAKQKIGSKKKHLPMLCASSSQVLLAHWRERNKVMSDDKLSRIETMLKGIVSKIDNLETKVDELYEDVDDNEFVPKVEGTSRFISEDEIYKNGQKVPYNKLEGDQVYEFKNFLSYIRMHEGKFTSKEYDYAGFADKNFSDTRISDNMRRILGQAYAKVYKEPWKFRFIRGYLYKWEGQKAWEWEDGSRD
jgi:hypothetical protein